MSILEIIKNVVSSWQVIAAAVIIIIFISMFRNAAKSYRRPRVKKERKNPFKKKKAESASVPTDDMEVTSSGDSNEELGLEEA